MCPNTTPTSSTDSGSVTAALRTLADLLVRIDAETALGVRERRDYRGAVRTACAMLGVAPDAVPADAAEISRRLAAIPKPLQGRAAKTVANVRWRIGRAIALVTGTASPPRALAVSPRWAALRAQLATPRLRHGLSRLIREASARGVEPEQVSGTLLDAIAQRLAARSGTARAQAFRAQAASCWNEAASQIAAWPAITLMVSPRAARPRRLPLGAFPLSFQRDLESYLAWAARSGRLAGDGAGGALSAATVRLRREHLRLAAAALARRLGYARRVIDLATLVEPVNFKLLLTEYLEVGAGAGAGAGAGRGASAFVRGLAVTLFGVARQWVKAPAWKLDALGQFKRRLGSGAPGLAERHRRAIEPFADPAVLAALLGLPERLLAQAAAGRSLQPRAVRTAQVGVAIALLLTVPLRLRQLAALRLGHEVQRPADGTGPLSISVDGSGASQVPVQWVGGGVGDLVGGYLDHCHAALLPNPQGWVFPRTDGSRVSEAALRHGIGSETRRALGVALTPGRFRHLAAALVLRERPGDLELVRRLLGHRDPRTTSRLYAGIGVRGAATAYAAVLDRSARGS